MLNRGDRLAIIHRINSVLELMMVDQRYIEVHYNLRQLRSMKKTVMVSDDSLRQDIEKKVLQIPSALKGADVFVIRWMLLHEAVHLSHGDDVLVTRIADLLEHMSQEIFDQITEVIEHNCNIRTIELEGGTVDALTVGHKAIAAKEFSHLKPISVGRFHDLANEMINLICKSERTIQALMDRYHNKPQQEIRDADNKSTRP